MSVSTAQPCTKSGSRSCHVLGRRHFCGEFSHKMALLICPCAFRLRRHSPINGSSEMSKCISTHRLAQNVRLTSGARHFPREFSHKMAFVRCQCAFPLRSRRLAQNVGPGLGIHLLHSAPQQFPCKDLPAII